MSTNVSFTGLSIKINDEKSNKESLKELAKFLEYDEKELNNFDTEDYIENLYENKKNCWRIHQDLNGQIGIIYLIDDEYDVFDLDFKMSLEKLNELMGLLLDKIPQNYINMNADDVKIFAYLYYNGSDNPFTF